MQGHASSALRIISAGFFFCAYGMAVAQSFNGPGNTWTPTIVNLVIFWGFEVPLAWYLSHHGARPARRLHRAGDCLLHLRRRAGAPVFRRGRWKQTRV